MQLQINDLFCIVTFDTSNIRYFVEQFTWQKIYGTERAKNVVLYFIWCVIDFGCFMLCIELIDNAVSFLKWFTQEMNLITTFSLRFQNFIALILLNAPAATRGLMPCLDKIEYKTIDLRSKAKWEGI